MQYNSGVGGFPDMIRGIAFLNGEEGTISIRGSLRIHNYHIKPQVA